MPIGDHIRSTTEALQGDTRRRAYERGLTILRGRQSLIESLSAEQIEYIIQYDGPEIVGARAHPRPAKR